ncbi:hypothetical protein SAE02_61460 [Skermanella aerolata]|uniref:Uncharacterized protein n=1 Tax=Skermanella aerolata TaxID=393310 RepID=A0A512DZT1_9PROT|nr:hypothetical protein [Skermanella aerolata]KJB91895.1 hypothetical protein N826_25600 [Skermanella aerolata KACC 11604]GEO41998.1 hypothetical protein SAE02_61460 [Skermanella aerolata]
MTSTLLFYGEFPEKTAGLTVWLSDGIKDVPVTLKGSAAGRAPAAGKIAIESGNFPVDPGKSREVEPLRPLPWPPASIDENIFTIIFIIPL